MIHMAELEEWLSDYFYGDESEQFKYFQIPRLLITSPRFKSISTDSKLLYGMLLDRMGLSVKNGWYDEQGKVYIYYTLEEICEDLNCARDKGMKLLAELDTRKGVGLIERVKQGQGKPTKIYVKRFTTGKVPPPKAPEPVPPPEVEKIDIQRSEIPTSRGREKRLAEVGKIDPNYTKVNYPDLSYPNPSYPPAPFQSGQREMDRYEIRERIKENISCPRLYPIPGYTGRKQHYSAR